MSTEKRNYPKFLFKIEDVEFPERMNSRQFGSYEHPTTQKTVYLLNPDGRSIESGFITSQLTLLFNVERLGDAQKVRFLMDHPENIDNGGSGFSLKDIEKESENQDDDLIKELELESEIMSLQLRKLRAVASALNLNYNLGKKGLQAQIIRRIRTEQSISNGKKEPGYISVERIVNAKKTAVLLDVNQMVEYGLININQSGIYVNGNHNLGLDAEQVVVYFDREPALYSILKTELRKKLEADGKLDDGKDELNLKM